MSEFIHWLNFQWTVVNNFMLYINNNRHLARKYAWIFVHGHYLFGEASNLQRACSRKTVSLEERIMSKDN